MQSFAFQNVSRCCKDDEMYEYSIWDEYNAYALLIHHDELCQYRLWNARLVFPIVQLFYYTRIVCHYIELSYLFYTDEHYTETNCFLNDIAG
jgi:hypothetical protein